MVSRRVSITKMSEEQRQNRKSQLARAMAKGQSVGEWSRQSGVAERTAYRWAKEAKFKAVHGEWIRSPARPPRSERLV